MKGIRYSNFQRAKRQKSIRKRNKDISRMDNDYNCDAERKNFERGEIDIRREVAMHQETLTSCFSPGHKAQVASSLQENVDGAETTSNK
jgi:hypothetical protein